MDGGFGAYGKMPTAGDFFRINPPTGFIPIWDKWLQQLLLEGQETYGAGFDDHYLSAPIWRFTLAAGQAGPTKVMGILMPSIDRVGRQFPLTLMSPLVTPGPPALDHFREGDLFEKLENIALSALEDDMTRDRLADDLASVEYPTLHASVPLRRDGPTYVLTGSGEQDVTVQTYLASALLAEQAPQSNLWTAMLNHGPHLMISHDLPLARAGAGLFDLTAPIWREAKPI